MRSVPVRLNAFVARWCVGSKVETAAGVFLVREDEPASRTGAGCTARLDRDFGRLVIPSRPSTANQR